MRAPHSFLAQICRGKYHKGHTIASDSAPPAGPVAYKPQMLLDREGHGGNVLRYQREYQVKEVKVTTERLPDLKKFYRQIAADERASAVLQRVP